MSACLIDGCERRPWARGWCNTHYARWHRKGDPLWEPPSNIDRFAAMWQANTATGCWEWTAAMQPNGYPVFSVKGKNVYAHRFAYELWVGPIPAGLTIDHLCNNPPCVNPSHLEAVTMGVNGLRSNNFAGVNARKTHCLRGHELAGDNLYLTSYGSRACKECKRLRRRWAKEASR